MLYQVNRLVSLHNLAKRFYGNLQHASGKNLIYPLKSRTLLKVSGSDTPVFLQGLITNDMQHFEEGATSIYAMFLNNKGRVLYDTLIYKWEGNNSFLIECDVNVHKLLQNHLKVYKLRRKVEIVDMSKNLSLFVLMPSPKKDIDTQTNVNKDVHIYKDPRLIDLGHRVIASNGEDTCVSSFGDNTVLANETDYNYIRYKLGVSEGAEELPPGTCFPLEANCDYLHGVSFHKGCYIGQELTARVHHTGVVRKRIMPFRFTGTVEGEIKKDSVITADDEKKSSVGKIKTFINDYGLGLIRIKEALEAKSLEVDKHPVKVIKPHWWPIEAPKEKITVKPE